MKAVTAKRLTQRATTAAARKQAKEQEFDAKRLKAERARYMRNEYPLFLARIYKQIQEATSHGRRSITVVDPPGHAWEALQKDLRANGYTIGSSTFTQGEYDNMGDFNAPCNVWREPYWSYKVGW